MSRRKDPCDDDGTCPACGGLECLCRPRFFAGQLLTERELNALDHYLVEKNKLHNRHLHGWGVVCGLEVVCHPCDDAVTVREGYALSPCGSDIIVCQDGSADICDLIQKCRDRDRRDPDCNPPRPGVATNCAGQEETWTLSICYRESPKRGMTPLLHQRQCAGGCHSGGHCDCRGGETCNCQGGSRCNRHAGHAGAKPRNVAGRDAAHCEPTMICEGYSFKVHKKPAREDKPTITIGNATLTPSGRLDTRLLCCLRDLMLVLEPLPGSDTPNALYTWFCKIKKGLQENIAGGDSYDCRLDEKLANLACPDPTQHEEAEFRTAFSPVLGELVGILVNQLLYCFCSALLPPCPEPADDDCVPLASVTVRYDESGRCKIVDVCNWDARRFVASFPNLGYWLSFLPLFDGLRERLVDICCNVFDLRWRDRMPPRAATAPVATTAPFGTSGAAAFATGAMSGDATGGHTMTGNAATRKGAAFTTLLLQAALDPDRIVDAQSLIMATLGLGDSERRPQATPLELRNPLAVLLINQLGRPLVGALRPDLNAVDTRGDTLGGAVGRRLRQAADATVAASERQASVEERLAELKAMVEEQQAVIEQLRKANEG